MQLLAGLLLADERLHPFQHPHILRRGRQPELCLNRGQLRIQVVELAPNLLPSFPRSGAARSPTAARAPGAPLARRPAADRDPRASVLPLGVKVAQHARVSGPYLQHDEGHAGPPAHERDRVGGDVAADEVSRGRLARHVFAAAHEKAGHLPIHVRDSRQKGAALGLNLATRQHANDDPVFSVPVQHQEGPRAWHDLLSLA